MKINFKKIIFLFILIFLIIYNLNLNYSFAQKVTDPSLQNPNSPPQNPTSPENPILSENPTSSSTSTPQEPPNQSEPKRPTSNIDMSKDPDMKEALYACEKAVKLAQMYGFLVDYSPDWKKILEKTGLKEHIENLVNNMFAILNVDKAKIANEVKKEIMQKFEVDPDKIDNAISSSPTIFEAAKNILSNKFNDFFKNSDFSKKINNEVNNIIKDGVKTLIGEENEYVKGLIGDIGKEISGFLDTSVPTNDKNTQEAIKKSTRAIVESNNQNLNELKRQQAIQTTREKCFRLLKQTVSQIKNSLMFQLTTQIADWVINENTIKSKDFIKMAGASIANNFISQIAPQLCSTFKRPTEFELGIGINLPGFPSPGYMPPPFEWNCTLDQVKANIKDFFNDFREGKWEAYFELIKPQNNWMGASLMLNLKLSEEYAKNMEELEMLTKNGFIGKNRCIIWRYYDYNSTTREFITTEKTLSFTEFEEYKKKIEESPNKTLSANFSGPVLKGASYYLINSKTATTPVYKYLIGLWVCEDTEITQPPSIAENLIQKATVQEMEILKEAEDLEQYFYYIRNSIIHKLVKEGYKGLRELLPEKVTNITDEIPGLR